MITSKLPPAVPVPSPEEGVSTGTSRSSITIPRRFQEDLPSQGGVIIPAGSNFKAVFAAKRTNVILVYGPGQTGKTTFALKYAKDPVAQINFDGRDTVALHEAQAIGRRIMRIESGVPPKADLPTGDVKRIAASIADSITADIEAACEASMRGNVSTICLDTATEFALLLNRAETGADKASSGDWDARKAAGRVKERWWNIVRMVQSSNANLVVLAREKKVYQNDVDTGRLTYDCPKVVFDAADIACEIRLKTVTERRVKTTMTELEIVKAGNNRPMLFTTWDETTWGDNPFAFLCTLLTPGSSEKDWS